MRQLLLIFISFTLISASQKTFAKNENWYWDFNFGLTSASYSGDIGSTKEKLDQTDTHRSGTTLGFGFYWPLTNRNLLGVALDTASDSYEKTSYYEKLRISISQTIFGPVFVRTFGPDDFVGLYFKILAGIASHSITTEIVNGNTTTRTSDDKSGIGAKAALGHGWLIGEDTRFFLSFDYAYAHTGFGDGQIIDLSAGFNF